MKLQTLIKIICAVLGVVGIIFLFTIVGAGDETIKMAAAEGDYSHVSPMVELARIVLIATLAITLLFSLRTLFSDKKKLKKSLISIGLFGLVVLAGFLMSEGVETPLKDGEVLSATGSRWVETGLRVFYLLAIAAIVSMAWSGARRIFKR